MNKSALQNQHVPGRKKSRVLNIRLLTGTLIVLAILAPALYCWNYYQTSRSAHSYLERADQLETKGQFRAAADDLNRFLQLYPNDGDVRLRLAKDFDQSAKDFQSKRRAIELYYQALGLLAAEKVPEIRIRLAELLLETQQFTPAQTEVNQVIKLSKELLNNNENDPRGKSLLAQGKRLLSLALYRQHQSGAPINLKGDESSPGKVIEEALELNTGDRELSLILAHIYREEPQLLSEEEQSLAKAEREH
jgi:tetratricopeptide (TPR) repeat protein